MLSGNHHNRYLFQKIFDLRNSILKPNSCEDIFLRSQEERKIQLKTLI